MPALSVRAGAKNENGLLGIGIGAAYSALNEGSRLADFPEMSVLKEGKLLGRHSFRALFIGKYVCIYRVV